MAKSWILLSLRRFGVLLSLCKQFDRPVILMIKQPCFSISFAAKLIRIHNTQTTDTQLLEILEESFLGEKWSRVLFRRMRLDIYIGEGEETNGHIINEKGKSRKTVYNKKKNVWR